MQIDWSNWQPTETAVLCFVFSGERVLLIEKLRGLGAGKVNAPGGRIESGETPEEAVVRELWEETSIVPSKLLKLGRVKFAFVNNYHLECWIFRADDHSGEAKESPEAIPFWNDVATVPFDRMWADDQHWFPYLVRRESFEGRFIFDDDKMLFYEVVGTESNDEKIEE